MMRRVERTLYRLNVFSDSDEVAESVRGAADTYWNKEAADHIDGLWHLCKEMAEQLSVLQEELDKVYVLSLKDNPND